MTQSLRRHLGAFCCCPLAVLLLAAAGCGRQPAETPGPGQQATPAAAPTTAASVTLSFWHIMNYAGPREVLAAAVQRFEAAHPGVKVSIQTFDNDAYKTKIAIEMDSGTPPDILFTWGGGLLSAWAKAGKVRDLTADLAQNEWQKQFLAQPLRLCMSADRIFAVPLDLSCVPVWYNAEIFAVQKLEPPQTLADLLRVCEQLRAKGITPMALGNQEQWPGAFFFVYLANRIGGTQLFLDVAERKAAASFADPAFVRAGEQLRQLVAAKAFSTGFNGIDSGAARTQFLNGQAAMHLMGTWLVARAAQEKPAFLAQLKCFPFPAVADGKGDAKTVVGGVNCGFAVSSTCKRQDLAVALLRALTTPEVGDAWCAIGRIPAIRVPDAALARLPAPTREALALLQASETLQPYYDQYLSPRLAEAHKNTTQGIFANTLTPAAAAEQMEKSAKEAAPAP